MERNNKSNEELEIIKELTIKELTDAYEFHFKEMIYFSELRAERLAAKVLDLTNQLHGLDKGFETQEENCIKTWLENGLTDDAIIEGICQERYYRHRYIDEAKAEEDFERRRTNGEV